MRSGLPYSSVATAAAAAGWTTTDERSKVNFRGPWLAVPTPADVGGVLVKGLLVCCWLVSFKVSGLNGTYLRITIKKIKHSSFKFRLHFLRILNSAFELVGSLSFDE